MMQQGSASHSARSHLPILPPLTNLLNKMWLTSKLLECASMSLLLATPLHLLQACLKGLMHAFHARNSLRCLELGTFEGYAFSMSTKHRIEGRGRSEHGLPCISVILWRLLRLLSRLLPRRLGSWLQRRLLLHRIGTAETAGTARSEQKISKQEAWSRR